MTIYQTFINQLPNQNLAEVCHTLRDEKGTYPTTKILKKFNLPFFMAILGFVI